jgi:hypothetical protein
VWSVALCLPRAVEADTTTVLDFDPPSFAAGQTLSSLPGITFPDHPVVFTPASRITILDPQPIRGGVCGKWLMRWSFPREAGREHKFTAKPECSHARMRSRVSGSTFSRRSIIRKNLPIGRTVAFQKLRKAELERIGSGFWAAAR